ncbi:hypothetical protein VHEMI01396 [[Torrubiella] hemipterigena]|uniref:LCCL domain-containing protein n=1 Tax=[Torrubiella] hemipterigena TaxID=1531966 RepID=A0A0A1T4N3_9HYPO|nr:hypothetical protein VHEMI01396 [[Torrubiella] hemipterigena]
MLDDDESQPLMTDSHNTPGPSASDAANKNDMTSSSSETGRADGTESPLREPIDTSLPTPRFIRDQDGQNPRWNWVPYPIRRTGTAIATWARGPQPPRRYRIKPLFPKVQEFPLQLVDRFLSNTKHRWLLVFFYLALWAVTFALVKRQGTIATDIAGFGQPKVIGCGSTYWASGNSCGLDGTDCRPFESEGFAFRCPANCASYKALNPRAVGDQEVVYAPFIIGGPANDSALDRPIYRGDSYLCGAAIHAGVVSNQDGGCGVVGLIGSYKGFVASKRHGISSFGFDSYFPLAFEFNTTVNCDAQDTRWSLLAVSTVWTGILALFTSSPALFFFPTFIGIFVTTGLAMDPPPFSTLAALISDQVGKILPALFCAWVIYDKMGVRRTLKGLRAQIEKTILWLGACWVGALTNYTLDFIPIQRLNGHDLDQQPGAKAALAVIVIILFVIIVFQVHYFQREGRFLKYIKLYALLLFGIIICLTLPSLNLRIHHYILALLLLPGTSLQTRPSLLYQGLLVGLFINGISRWGFDSILQTSAELQGDAQKGSLLPLVHPPLINWNNATVNAMSNITLEWDLPPADEDYDGVSVLINDVERFRGYFNDGKDAAQSFTWVRNSTLNLPEYFRFAYMMGAYAGDYTKAATWTADGAWKEMQPGPSK